MKHRILMLFAVLFLCMVVVYQPTPTAFALTPTPSPTVTPLPDDVTVIWPTLMSVEPSNTYLGGVVTVKGTGGYLIDGEGGYNESSRYFDLWLDEQWLGKLNCYVNYCQGTVTVPDNLTTGVHDIKVDGGSTVSITVLDGTITPTPTTRCVSENHNRQTCGEATPTPAVTISVTATPTPTTPCSQEENDHQNCSDVTPTPIPTEQYRPWADLTVALSNPYPDVQEQITVSVTLNKNNGCDYSTYDIRLSVADEGMFRFDSDEVIGPGVGYPAVFTMTAIAEGTTHFEATAYGEYYCDFWNWAYVSGESDAVTVTSETPPILDISVPITGSTVMLGTNDQIEFGSETFTDTVIFRSLPYHTPGNLSTFYELSAIDGQGRLVQPSQSYTLTLYYAVIPPDVDPAELKIFYKHDGQWFVEPTSRVDTARQVVIANPTHFSQWGVMVDSTEEYLHFLPVIMK